VQPTSNSLRKAAILIAALDTPTAEVLLGSLPEEHSAQVRRTMIEMDDLDAAEQDAVMEEFLRAGDSVACGYSETARGGHPREPVELVLSSSAAIDEAPAEPFAFLSQSGDEKLLSLLTGEHPQTVAVVVSYLPPDRAASVLAALDGAMQVDVLKRLAQLERTEPDVLRELESGLKSRFSELLRRRHDRSTGLNALCGMVDAADGKLERTLLSKVERNDQNLVACLRPPSCDFEDLARIGHDALSTLLSTLDLELTLLALAGAPLDLVERVLELLDPKEAKRLRQSIECLGPVRLADIDEAQRQIAERARQLALEGRIELEVIRQAAVGNRQ
jgi:flagellar motor switch protein FliG